MNSLRWDDDERGSGVADGRRVETIGGDSLFYEVATGMLAPDTHFKPHGHVLVLRVNGAFGGG
jgi:hypothetical protein